MAYDSMIYVRSEIQAVLWAKVRQAEDKINEPEMKVDLPNEI